MRLYLNISNSSLQRPYNPMAGQLYSNVLASWPYAETKNLAICSATDVKFVLKQEICVCQFNDFIIL